jgi:ABC-2 type transport system permease protein
VDNVRYLRSDIAIAWRIARLRIRGQMTYRASFLMQIFGNLVINAAEVFATLVMFNRFESLGGWSFQEMMFLTGIAMVSFAIGDTISNGVQSVPALIRAGEFDRLMIRPLSIYMQAIVNEVSLRHVGQLILGCIVFAYSITQVPVSWSVGNVAYLALMIASGAAIFLALFTVEAIISFWTVNSVEAVNAFTYGGSDMAQYPLHIFPRLFRGFLLWVLPLGFVCYYPAVHMLGKDDPLGLPEAARFLGVAMAIVFCLVIGSFWRLALNRHTSTGS